MRRRCFAAPAVLLIVAFMAGGAPPAWANDDSDSEEEQDHDLARAAVERGEALPLEQVLAAVRREVEGQIIGVDLEKEDGGWIYEFRVVKPDGRVLEVKADADTAEIIGVEGD